MLSLLDRGPTRLCDGLARREVLRVGGLAALGLSLPDLLRNRATAKPAAGRVLYGVTVAVTAKAFLQGQLGHLGDDGWDVHLVRGDA